MNESSSPSPSPARESVQQVADKAFWPAFGVCMISIAACVIFKHEAAVWMSGITGAASLVSALLSPHSATK